MFDSNSSGRAAAGVHRSWPLCLFHPLFALRHAVVKLQLLKPQEQPCCIGKCDYIFKTRKDDYFKPLEKNTLTRHTQTEG